MTEQIEKTKMDLIVECLGGLAALDRSVKELEAQQERELDALLTEEQKSAKTEIVIRYTHALNQTGQLVSEMERNIKSLAELYGASVWDWDSNYMAVFTPAGWKWDGKMLEGMAAVVPAIMGARKPTQPTISIRRK